MTKHPYSYIDPDRSEDGQTGPYDRDEAADADLWFLPSPDAEVSDWNPDPTARPMLPDLVDIAAWRAAQAELTLDLAQLATRFGALDERLRTAPDGWKQRLALLEAAELSWHAGDRITAERLALWTALRLANPQEDTLALARSGWAMRRLSGGPPPDTGGWQAGLTAFLGRQEPYQGGTEPHQGVGDIDGRIADWAGVMAQAAGLHPFARACLGTHVWHMAEVSGSGSAQEIEATVVAARIAAQVGRGGAIFLPLVLGGPGALRPGGSPYDRLARWLAGAEQSTLAALLHLDRLADWQARANRAVAQRSGRTPALLAELLAVWPLVSAPMAEAQTGASRAAVQRNLDAMAGEGLIREVTGQGRYRVWTARL
ncbi:helix-turn-helix domain-containing protein [Pseudogemmobacter sp. W21_MBD1_M6]|uniref:helix-turn-helix domain-containing protein n=1 Tax=Pseudogemmobacter sp. W21_MBD1_M6 TaxID=3240271 RepID=UPI003F9C46FC